MPLAYFDCFAGAGGDMIVGALLHAGADEQALRDALSQLGIDGLAVHSEIVHRGGMSGRRFTVESTATDPPHRRLCDIVSLIEQAGLAPRAADRAKRIFARLAEAEAAVHNVSVEEVHFHEVGAIDSIADIVGACVALELLDVDRVCCSAIALGSGSVTCSHGTLPVPCPATSRLVVGAKVVPGQMSGEATTPTAAAVLTALAESFGPLPAMEVRAVGYGAGTREDGPLPNLLRVFIGRCEQSGTADAVVELSANLDDCSGEIIGSTIDSLLAAGCLDAWATPGIMKKSRPAWILSALCTEADVTNIEGILFSETTTFGVRRRAMQRTRLQRTWETVETPYGPVRLKVGRLAGQIVTSAPEFSDCAAAAEAHHVAAREVYGAAEAAFRQGQTE